MANLLRLSACLFFCWSTHASAIQIAFSGHLFNIDDPDNHLTSILGQNQLSVGDDFYVNLNLENPLAGSSNPSQIAAGALWYPFYDAGFELDVLVGSNSVLLSNLNNEGIISIGENINQNFPPYSFTGDVWNLEHRIYTDFSISNPTLPGFPNFTINLNVALFDFSGEEIQNTDFMIPETILDFDQALFSITKYTPDSQGNIILSVLANGTATIVPLPAGIYLFLSGLVGLGLMRGRNG